MRDFACWGTSISYDGAGAGGVGAAVRVGASGAGARAWASVPDGPEEELSVVWSEMEENQLRLWDFGGDFEGLVPEIFAVDVGDDDSVGTASDAS